MWDAPYWLSMPCRRLDSSLPACPQRCRSHQPLLPHRPYPRPPASQSSQHSRFFWTKMRKPAREAQITRTNRKKVKLMPPFATASAAASGVAMPDTPAAHRRLEGDGWSSPPPLLTITTGSHERLTSVTHGQDPHLRPTLFGFRMAANHSVTQKRSKCVKTRQ